MAIRHAASMPPTGAVWRAGGYSGMGNVAPLIGSLRGHTAVIAGNACSVFEELDYVLSKIPDAIIFAANHIGCYLPKVHHWATLHGDMLDVWKAARYMEPRDHDFATHTDVSHVESTYVWEGLSPLFALSGYFAMQIAYIMDADQIILCGCPGSPARRFFEAAPRKDFGYGGLPTDKGILDQLINECNRVPELKARVRSQSGLTKQFFGRWNYQNQVRRRADGSVR